MNPIIHFDKPKTAHNKRIIAKQDDKLNEASHTQNINQPIKE